MADYLGSNGKDSIVGTAADDFIDGLAGNDLLRGAGGDDTLQGGSGDDTLNGGLGYDYADYSGATTAVSVDLSAGSASGGAGNDSLIGIEAVIGSLHDDTLTAAADPDYYIYLSGNDGNDFLQGSDGSDELEGGRGSDTLAGGLGYDIAYYTDSTLAINANLHLGTVDDDSGQDSLVEIEGIGGSAYGDILTGNYADNDFYGEGGDDLIFSDLGNDFLRGGAGSDVLNGGEGRDIADYSDADAGIDGNLATGIVITDSGNDTLIGIEEIDGSDFNDTLTGDSLDNFLYGLWGDDQLLGGEGDDQLQGSAGSDTLDGGAGYDKAHYTDADSAVHVDLAAKTASDDSGSDVLLSIEAASGSAFNDTLLGDAGDNEFFGDAGDDLIDGGDGDDQLDGGAGQDSLSGGAGFDTVTYDSADHGVIVDLAAGTADDGGASDQLSGIEAVDGSGYDDQLLGDALANVLYGDSGNDLLLGHDGDDELQGGAGNDSLDGGNGFDIAYYTDAGAGVMVDLAADTAFDGIDHDHLSNIEAVDGSDFADQITGDDSDNDLFGQSGDDLILGAAGSDLLRGDDGDDTLLGGSGGDIASYLNASAGVEVDLLLGMASGAAGNDLLDGIESIIGSNFSDTLSGDAGANFIFGAAGDDLLTGGLGSDILDGGAGDDSIDGGNGEIFSGERDSVVYLGAAAGVSVDLALGIASGGGGNDLLSNISDVVGSDFADSLNGNSDNNLLWGDSGNDELSGREGEDTLAGGAGDDTLDGGEATDFVNYQNSDMPVAVDLQLGTATGDGSDQLSGIEGVIGSQGSDTLSGDAGANLLYGQAGDDQLAGGGGDDILQGGSGNDTLSGGEGQDTFLIDLQPGDTDRITDLEIGESLHSPVALRQILAGRGDGSGLQAGELQFGEVSDGVTRLYLGVDGLAGADRQIDLVGEFSAADFAISPDFLYQLIYDPRLNLPMTLVGSEGSDTQHGGTADDLLDGLGGDDWLFGHTGNDQLLGGPGNDILYGELGDDTLDGGDGQDHAYFNNAAMPMVINLALGIADGAGHDLLINIENIQASNFNDKLTGDGGNNVLWGNDGADSLDGGSGNDKLEGGKGNDMLWGRAGSDSLFGGKGVDTLSGGAGDDTYYRDDSADQIIEIAGGGVDRVISGVASYTLDANIENAELAGPDGDLIGNALDNQLSGGKGNNLLDGGSGNDTASYRYSPAAVSIDLSLTGAQNTGSSGSDTLLNIENLIGSAFNDLLKGHAGANRLDGDAGNDTMAGDAGDDTYVVRDSGDFVSEIFMGGTDTVISWVSSYTLGGNVENGQIASSDSANLSGNGFDNTLIAGAGDNILHGATGRDTASYATAGSAVTVTLATTTLQATGGSGNDQLISIENLVGSRFADQLSGNQYNNVLDGGAGIDTLSGGLGNDSYAIRQSLDLIIEGAGAGTDTAISYLASYTLRDNVENARIAHTGKASITGNSLANLIESGAGDNVMRGGTGFDGVSYANAGSAVTVSLATNTAQNTGGSGLDTLISIEKLVGSAYADSLTGNAFANVLIGGPGQDTLAGGGGNDRFKFNASSDSGSDEASADLISDFSSGDLIDLTGIDADSASDGNQAFSEMLAADGEFSLAGQLRFANGSLYGNTDSDSAAELVITLTGVSSLDLASIVL